MIDINTHLSEAHKRSHPNSPDDEGIHLVLFQEVYGDHTSPLNMALVGDGGDLLNFAAFYIHHYQGRIIQNHTRAIALAGLFILLLTATKIGVLLANQNSWATGSAVAAAIILTIAYYQRFALGMSIFFCVFAQLAAGPLSNISLFLTMTAGAVTCCFSLKEIRTRMKLLEISALATVVVFVTSVASQFWAQNQKTGEIFANAGYHAIAAFAVGLLIQSLLPLIEKNFRIATSMTLLDYSDANQPLLKRLAMEAPGALAIWRIGVLKLD